jgi:cell division protein FtsQ
VSARRVGRRGLPGGAAAVADKRFRRADARSGKRRGAALRVWRLVRVVLALGALVALVAFASVRVVDAQLLSVDRVLVRGNQRLSTGEIDALIGDVRGESLLLVDLDRVEARLRDSPWVESVTVRRLLPSTVDVRIVEREPVAIARLGQQLYLVDGTGVIVDGYGPQYVEFDLPIVDGMAAPAAAGGRAIDPGRAQLTARFLADLASRPELRRAVSQVDVSRDHNVTVLLDDDPTLLYLGDEKFMARLRTYLELRPTLNERWEEVDYVDLRFGQKIVAKERDIRKNRQ